MPSAAKLGLDIAHGDRAAERGPKPPEVTVPICGRPASLDLGALARRRAAVGQDADAPARRPFDSSRCDALGAGKAALLAPALLRSTR